MTTLDDLRDTQLDALEQAEKAALRVERRYRRLSTMEEVTMGQAAEWRACARAAHTVVREIRTLIRDT